MPDLRSFSLDDMYRCSADIRSIGESATDGDEAARHIISYLYEQFRSPDTRAPECVLVRLFRSQPLAKLEPADAARVMQALGGPSGVCLSLRASRGVEREWNSPSTSRGHRLLPLASREAISSMPMVAALASQLGISTEMLLGSPYPATSEMQVFNVFHVEQARGSLFVPAQAGFVEPYAVASVVGIGGRLPPSDIFVVLLFSRVTISKDVAQRFRVLAPSIGLALLSSERRASRKTRARGYELIVRYHENLALHQNRELERIAGELASSLREREALLADEQDAKADAQDANRAKDEFLATLGHELRNPLSPILTAVELMKLRGARSRETEVIERQVAYLARLVDDLLDISRIARGKIQVAKRPVEIASVVARAVEIVSPRLEQRKQRLALDVPRESLVVNGDAGRLAQVVSNLLDNASKYSDTETEIRLSAERSGDRVRLRVRDQGIGIPSDMLERIFDSFIQHGVSCAGSARRRPVCGLGLGLTIVRSLVELHGGSVSVRSEGPGKGSEFFVELPLLTKEARESSAPAIDEHAMPVTGQQSRRVLLVDDNQDAANMLADALTELGHEVFVAKDGPTALAAAPEFRPEVALLDIGLPVMDGYELASRLRALPGARSDLRLIALTGYGQEGDRRRSERAGFAAHLVKPITLDGLMQAVGR